MLLFTARLRDGIISAAVNARSRLRDMTVRTRSRLNDINIGALCGGLQLL